MPTIGEHLDRVQNVLNDDGTIWSRAELLDYFRDGYRLLAEGSSGARTLTAYDVPPRETFSYVADWQREFLPGPARKFTYSTLTDQYECTQTWEVEQLGGVAPTNSIANATSLWEIVFAGQAIDLHFRVYFQRAHSQVLAVWWDHRHIEPISVRELDTLEDAWWRIDGEPYYWTRGLGPDRSIEIYEIDLDYQQSYQLTGTRFGIMREFSGDRTYSVVKPVDSTIATGIIRRITSPDRQYFPSHQWQNKGTIRRIASSDENLLVHSVELPRDPLLEEADELIMFPPQFGKYLRYYTLSQAFNRQGEGYDGNMALHYEQRWERALVLMRRLLNVLHRDATYARQPKERVLRRVPLPQFPSDFPNVIWR